MVVRRYLTPVSLLGLAAVAAARLLTLPRSLWEWDEILFVKGVEEFDPLHHQPHPPGYPLLIGLGKAVNAVVGDPFTSLVALSVICSLIGYLALAAAYRGLLEGPGGLDPPAAAGVGAAGSALFHLSPTLLVYGPLALSDAPALMFLALALAASTRLPAGNLGWAAAFGAFASAAIGCRPQLALSVLPMVAVALALNRGFRRWGAVLAAFTLVSLLWFVPLVVAVGGLHGLAGFLGKQAQLFATYDAKVPRAELSPQFIAFRFLAHPWGQRWTSLPVLALAVTGAVALLARRRSRPLWPLLPLAVLTGIELALCLFSMNPADGVRYALPSLLGVAFAAAYGCRVVGEGVARLVRRPRLALAGPALVVPLVAGFVLYTAPLLEARATTLSPPAQAAAWIRREVPPDAVLLVDKELAAHASYLLPEYRRANIQDGLQQLARRRDVPVYLIADGKSGWGDLQTFRWPDCDPYGKLTRNLYRVVTVSPVPPDRRYRAMRGVYGYEPSLRLAQWRWLAPDAALRIYPGEARAVAFGLRLPPQASLKSVRVTIMSPSSSTAVEILQGEERRAVLTLSPADRGGVVEIHLRSDSSFIPAQTRPGQDARRLAVQLLSVEQLK
jgi:hypothetical protein